ncbi:MAG: HAMP domain-containing sensor histidine kinase [Solirubrobacteraceae bacterium]|jgi:signal transduction histidine kinase
MRIRSPLRASLRWRLTAWVAGVIVLSAAITFVVVYRDTDQQLRNQVNSDVGGDATELAQSLRLLSGDSASQIAAAAGRYVNAQPFSATSAMLFVLVPGAAPQSNHPELFGAAHPDDGESAAQQASENVLGRALAVPHLGYSTRPAPDVGQLRILERAVHVGRLTVVAGAGEPLKTVSRAEHGLARAFVLAGGIALVLALFASYLAGARFSAPLRRMAAVAARVDAGDLLPRMTTSPGRSDEVQTLADAFNRMLDRLAEDIAAQRSFIADASHELRTPLTVIRGQLEVLAAQTNPSGEEVRRVERLVAAEIARTSRLVDDLLLLTQAERPDFLRIESIDLEPYLGDLWDGLSLTAERRFELGELPPGSLRADPDRLAQALRNLARNAIEHTRERAGLVRLDVTSLAPDRLRFSVSDDGDGIPAGERTRVFERFHRTDPARTRSAGGAGLGLAIVRAIAEAHRGSVAAGENADGRGARIDLELPGFTPAPAAPRTRQRRDGASRA